jgi:hypothetical protein
MSRRRKPGGLALEIRRVPATATGLIGFEAEGEACGSKNPKAPTVIRRVIVSRRRTA